MPTIVRRFLRWYDRYDDFNTVFAAFLFSIQVLHLAWLTTNVVLPRLFGINPVFSGNLFNTAIAVVDYTEIPAIIATSLVYIRSFSRRPRKRDIFYLFFLNIQWLHLFWITDEIVLGYFGQGFTKGWNPFAAWSAIVIDYLELPVIFETIKRATKILTKSI